MKKILITLTTLSLSIPVAAVPVAAANMGQHLKTGSNVSVEQTSDYRRRDRDYKHGYRDGRRDQRLSANSRVWRGNDGRYRCKRDNGTTGLLIGAGVGGLAGHEIAGRGDKTLGVILGAAGGALLGREIDRDKYRCR